MPIIGFVPIARPTFDVPYAEEMTGRVYNQLQAAGYNVIGDQSLIMSMDDIDSVADTLNQHDLDLLLMLQASFADSTMVMRLVELVDAPLVMWALPEPRVGGRLRLNSFCGINLAGHGLTREGYTYDYIYAEPEEDSALTRLATIARAGEVRRKLRTARIGRIGEHPAGFDTCQFDAGALKQAVGVEIVQLELQQVFEEVRQAEPEAVSVVYEQIRGQLSNLENMDRAATRGTLSTYLTLDRMAETQHLNGIAVRCWPEFFTDLGCSACGAMSLMTDKMMPCSCEADVNGTITQLILQWVSGEAAFGTDVVSFDVHEDIAVLWHCGLAPLSMADPDVQPQAAIHSNRKMPLLMEFRLKPGRVTVARLSEVTGEYRLVIGGGEMMKAPPSFTGTSGTLRFDSGAQHVMDTIMNEGLEHHLAITYGDHSETLVALARMLNLKTLML
ncbi:MAG: L-fucose/L-arabinose isomerase family protein [Chloroflexi bacterium]|nr:L-fucose/L-arabinose isomerase family protein [Chloroflexota bacterium]